MRKTTYDVLVQTFRGGVMLALFNIMVFAADKATPVASAPAAQQTAGAPIMVTLEKILNVTGSHLIVPVGNYSKDIDPAKYSRSLVTLGLYDGDRLVQSFNLTLPQGSDPFWLAAYPLEPFQLQGKSIKLAVVDGKPVPESCRSAFDLIKVGSAAEELAATDYTLPYRNQFHASTRRGWTNDPNGLVFHHGKYHLYYQHNPFGIFWGNMHWGHMESTDLIHWEEKPIALYQKTVSGIVASGSGFIDVNNSAGLGKDTQFIAATMEGRSECLAYSKDGGITFTELPENPVVRHKGRDPKVIWYPPEQKWVMVVFDYEPCAETAAVPPMNDTMNSPNKCGKGNHIAFWESKNLRQWQRTGAFTDADRAAVYECPEMFELPVIGRPGESRWILLAAQNRYFIGNFDGEKFRKESGPHGSGHGSFYAAQTFSDMPDGRRIQMGWVHTETFLKQFPDQLVNQAFSLPHEVTLRETKDGLRLFFYPVKETEQLRGEVLAEGKNLTPAKANELLQQCQGELTEVLIEFAETTSCQLMINGINASFQGRSARIFTDRTINEIYVDDGVSYELRKLPEKTFNSRETRLTVPDGTVIHSLKVFRLQSIWIVNRNAQTLAPTLLGICGIKPANYYPMDGVSWGGLLRNEAWPFFSRQIAVQYITSGVPWDSALAASRNWRLIKNSGNFLLYDRANYPAQEKYVASLNPEVATALSLFYDEWDRVAYAEFQKPLYIQIGHAEVPEVMLYANDWQGAYCDNDFNLREGKAKGAWDIDGVSAGNYRVELSRWPFESGKLLTEVFMAARTDGAGALQWPRRSC